MTVEQATTAETALVGSTGKRGETRVMGPIAVGLALLSAFVTFVVLADLTPISPTHYVVVTLLLANAATGAVAAWHHRAGSLAGGAGPPQRARRRAAACAHRRAVLGDRRGAGGAGRDRRQRDARPRPGPAVLHAHARRDREFADRGGGLSARPCADRALRHHGDGVRHRAHQAGVRSGATRSSRNF